MQRVTFTALNNYLGLNNELLKSNQTTTPSTTRHNSSRTLGVPTSDTPVFRALEHDDSFQRALKSLRTALHVKDTAMLGDLGLLYHDVPVGAVVIAAGTESDLVYLVQGELCAFMRRAVLLSDSSQQEEVEVFRAAPGQFVGGTAVLSGETSILTVRALLPSRVVIIQRLV